MWAEIAFPGTVLLLKLLFKLAVEQELGLVDSLKAALAFPVDIAFLGLSYGVAIILTSPEIKAMSDPNKITGVFILLGVIAAFVVTMLSKKSDKAYIADRWRTCLTLALMGYAIASTMLFVAVYVKKLVV